MVSFCPEKFLLCFPTTVLILFIAGLLCLLCFEHDNLGAYSIPSETGLLIPSGHNNAFQLPRPSAVDVVNVGQTAVYLRAYSLYSEKSGSSVEKT
jgi:hypothetical protein